MAIPIPLFVCRANCARSVMAHYLYESLEPRVRALSAGIEPGEEVNPRALEMLAAWGADAGRHRPQPLTRALCLVADAIFVMAPEYGFRLLALHGIEFARKTYLFAEPFQAPVSLAREDYFVPDPSPDTRPLPELLRDYEWFHERVRQIRRALAGDPALNLVPAAAYLELWR